MIVESVVKPIEEMRVYLLAIETGNQCFCSRKQLRRTTLKSGATRGDAVATKAFLNCVCTPTLSSSKSERQNIETTCRRSRKGEGAVIILGLTVEERDRSSWDACDRRPETIIYACLEPTGVEEIKV